MDTKCVLALAACILLSSATESEKRNWSWDSQNSNDQLQAETIVNQQQAQTQEIQQSQQFYYQEGAEASSSGFEQNGNETEVEDIVDHILVSTREGRNVEGFDEVYSDPGVQDALQKGDDREARNVIKERLCALGLMQCGEEIHGKRPFGISPEELVYAQPVAINPVGRPIPTIPINGPKRIPSRGTYGPPKPIPFPPRPLKYPPPGKFGPPPPPNKPPRRGYSPIAPSKPFYAPPNKFNQDFYEDESSFVKPLGVVNSEVPYQFDQSYQTFNKDKKVEVVVNAQGTTTPQQHVHHHFHHNSEAGVKPVIVNPVQSGFVNTGPAYLKPTYGVHEAGDGWVGNTYGGQTYASYGQRGDTAKQGLSTFGASGGLYEANKFQSQSGTTNGGGLYDSAKYPANSIGTSVGLYGSTSDLYKKELSLSSGNSNYLQSYADRYQASESSRGENYDCVCVPYDQCPSNDVIGRKDDLYLALDPRSLKSDIEAIVEDEERVITDGNGTMTVVRVPKALALNDTEAKNVTKRETKEETNNDPKAAEARQSQFGSLGNKKIQPTFGISFGLPNQGGGGYPISPYGPNPLVNPYGGAIGNQGINLGLVSVNPLVSLQVTKDDYGSKVLKPFVNLHVTPNNYLVHKFEDLLAYKKHVVFNKHKHVHYHKPHHRYPHYHHGPPQYHHGPPHYHHSPPHNHHDPHIYHGAGPIYSERPVEGPSYSGPSVEGPIYSGSPVEGPIYSRPSAEGPYHEDVGPPGPESSVYPEAPYLEHNPNYFDNPHNYGGGHYSEYEGNHFGRSVDNDSSLVHGTNLLNLYQQQYDDQNSYAEGSQYSRTGKSLSSGSSNQVKFPNDRGKRDVSEKSKPEKRQGYFGNQIGRPSTCGPRHVCCRRPLRPQVPSVGAGRQQCGIRHSQGINGRIKNPVYVDGDSEFGEYPWQVAILKKDPKESVYVCGGTLIDSLHIITAAHCVKTYTAYDLRVRLGEWDVNHDVEFYPYIERDITTVSVHPEFYAGTLYNDLAILRLDKPVDFTKQPHISPACLPSPHEDYTGTRCWTTGWGKDAFGDFGKYQNILKEVDVPIVNSGLCQRQMQQTRLGYEFKLHPGFICAGGEEGKDACKGDGGGPMVCERAGSWQVVGVVSWGIGCGQVGVPGVYVKVAHYLDWIRQVTQIY